MYLLSPGYTDNGSQANYPSVNSDAGGEGKIRFSFLDMLFYRTCNQAKSFDLNMQPQAD